MRILTLNQRRLRTNLPMDAVHAHTGISKGAVVNHHKWNIVSSLLDAEKYARLYTCSLEAIAKGYRNGQDSKAG